MLAKGHSDLRWVWLNMFGDLKCAINRFIFQKNLNSLITMKIFYKDTKTTKQKNKQASCVRSWDLMFRQLYLKSDSNNELIIKVAAD